MSPEYAIDGKFSVKSDVFSLGVLLLEIVTGKRNRGFHHPDHHHSLLGHVSTIDNSLSLSLCTHMNYTSQPRKIRPNGLQFTIGMAAME